MVPRNDIDISTGRLGLFSDVPPSELHRARELPAAKNSCGDQKPNDSSNGSNDTYDSSSTQTIRRTFPLRRPTAFNCRNILRRGFTACRTRAGAFNLRT